MNLYNWDALAHKNHHLNSFNLSNTGWEKQGRIQTPVKHLRWSFLRW